jgi:hypothetical protein
MEELFGNGHSSNDYNPLIGGIDQPPGDTSDGSLRTGSVSKGE